MVKELSASAPVVAVEWLREQARRWGQEWHCVRAYAYMFVCACVRAFACVCVCLRMSASEGMRVCAGRCAWTELRVFFYALANFMDSAFRRWGLTCVPG